MIPASIHQHVTELLEPVIGVTISSLQFLPVSGGSINLTYELFVNEELHFFCKINSISKFPALFEKEKNGLQILSAEDVIRVPKVILCTVKDDYQVLVLEWIEQELPKDDFWKTFADQLAALHHIPSSSFGLNEDNYMGALPQSNQYTGKWSDFFVVHRLVPQVHRAIERGLLEQSHVRQFEKLYKQISSLFAPEIPSLLHGDLWSGNFLCGENQKPVLIDPAVYFGHRHMDLGMTALFGGFDKLFYEAYQHHYPFTGNYREQWEVCNLYPLLIHLNLFGKSYLNDILKIIRRF